MIENCTLCGHSWGVTMTPRERVLCSQCARSTPWRRPEHYWNVRIWNYHSTHPHAITRSPKWWDQQTDLVELKYTAELAGASPETLRTRQAATGGNPMNNDVTHLEECPECGGYFEADAAGGYIEHRMAYDDQLVCWTEAGAQDA